MSRYWNLDRVMRFVLCSLGVIIALGLVYYLRGVLFPFIAAFLIAYIVDPIVNKLQKLVKKRVIAVIIVLAMNLVGSLLISALIIFPAMSAMQVFRSFKGVTICSAVLSVSCALTGMLISILGSTPVGSTIVAVDIAVFLIFVLIARLGRKGR